MTQTIRERGVAGCVEGYVAGGGEMTRSETNEANPDIVGVVRTDLLVFDAEKITAFATSLRFGPDVPAAYRRTYLIGIVLGPVIAAVAGLFDYDTEAWIWSPRIGFRVARFTKRPTPPRAPETRMGE